MGPFQVIPGNFRQCQGFLRPEVFLFPGIFLVLHQKTVFPGILFDLHPKMFFPGISKHPHRGPPTHRVSNPPQQQKRNFKNPKSSRIPKSKCYFPKSNVISPNVNVKYFWIIFEEFKVFENFCWWSRSQGFQKYLTKAPKMLVLVSQLRY